MYRQLSLSQRLTIERLHQQGASQSAIARQTGVHRSTIKRELDRNSQKGIYVAEDAQSVTLYRKRMAGTIAEFKQYKKRPVYKGYDPFPGSSSADRNIKHFRFKPGRWQLRAKRYQWYSPRKDYRPYDLHPNNNRPHFYASWKSFYENRYRFRDNALAERKRRQRRRKDFLRYLPEVQLPELRYALIAKHNLRKFRRNIYEQKTSAVKREMFAFEQQLKEITRRAKQKHQQEKKQEESHAPDKPTLSFIFILWRDKFRPAIRLRARAPS